MGKNLFDKHGRKYSRNPCAVFSDGCEQITPVIQIMHDIDDGLCGHKSVDVLLAIYLFIHLYIEHREFQRTL